MSESRREEYAKLWKNVTPETTPDGTVIQPTGWTRVELDKLTPEELEEFVKEALEE